jgi:hypothetical protein
MANRYWVGGSGSWTSASTTNWSTSSGGASGASVPTTTDAVIVDSNSGSPTITLTGALNCASLDTTGSTCTLTSTGTLTCAGNFTLSTTTTATFWSGGLTITGTSTLTPNGRTINCNLIINAAGLTVTLAGNSIFGQGAANNVTLTKGTLNLNNFSLTCNSFLSNNTNTKAIQFGTSGSINVNPTTVGNFYIDSTGFSYTGTSLITVTTSSSGLNPSISITSSNSGGLNFTLNSFGGTYSEASGNVYNNLIVSNGTLGNSSRIIYGNFNTGTGCTLSSGSALTVFAATAGTQTITPNGKIYDFPITFGTGSGTATYSVSGAFSSGASRTLTFNNGTLQFTSSTTNTVGSFTTGTSVLKYLTSSSSGTQATISQASGTVNATYLSVKDSNATGGAGWNAPIASSNVDAGNNTGWSFANPTNTGNYFLIF